MAGYIIYVQDTETTGIDCKKHDIIELSLARFSIEDSGTTEQKTWLIKAMNPQTIEEEALHVNKHKREDILHLSKFGKENYKLPGQVIIEIEQWVASDDVSAMDRVFAGQNPNFDLGFMKELWTRENSIETFPFATERGNRVLDIKQFALLIDLCTGNRRRYYNLGSLVEAFNAKKSKAHTAAGDVEMTADILRKFIGPLKDFISTQFKDFYSAEKLEK